MKNKKITSPLAISLFLLCGACTHYTDNTSSTEIYRYVNESSVEVALVGERQGYFDIPDSLVLQDGASYECSAGFPAGADMSLSFPYKEGDTNTIPYTYFPLKIYFDKTICMTYYLNETNRDLRNPFHYGTGTPSYVKTTREEKNKKFIKTINTYTYTFTAADYQNALKAQE